MLNTFAERMYFLFGFVLCEMIVTVVAERERERERVRVCLYVCDSSSATLLIHQFFEEKTLCDLFLMSKTFLFRLRSTRLAYLDDFKLFS